MSDHAQIQALSEDLAQSPIYSLQISDLRQEMIRQIERAHPATLDAIASVLGIRGERQ